MRQFIHIPHPRSHIALIPYPYSAVSDRGGDAAPTGIEAVGETSYLENIPDLFRNPASSLFPLSVGQVAFSDQLTNSPPLVILYCIILGMLESCGNIGPFFYSEQFEDEAR
jgi:hypothetical protein